MTIFDHLPSKCKAARNFQIKAIVLDKYLDLGTKALRSIEFGSRENSHPVSQDECTGLAAYRFCHEPLFGGPVR